MKNVLIVVICNQNIQAAWNGRNWSEFGFSGKRRISVHELLQLAGWTEKEGSTEEKVRSKTEPLHPATHVTLTCLCRLVTKDLFLGYLLQVSH